MERDCDVIIEYEFFIQTKEEAEDTEKDIETELNKLLNEKNYKNIIVDINLDKFEPDENTKENYAAYIIEVEYTDEPDENSKEARPQIMNEIDQVFDKLGLDCCYFEIYRDRSESLEEVANKKNPYMTIGKRYNLDLE